MLGFSEDRVPISWKKITQQWGSDSDINNCWGSLPGEGRTWQVGGSRLQGDPPSAEAEGVSSTPSPPEAAFVRPGFLRPGARGTESQIHTNGAGERGEGRGVAHLYLALVEGAEWVLDGSGLLFYFFLG